MSNIWEFNAPQYVNFNCLTLNDDDADEWFDTQRENTPVQTRSKSGKISQSLNSENQENAPPNIDANNLGKTDKECDSNKEKNQGKNVLRVLRKSPRLNLRDLKEQNKPDSNANSKRRKWNEPTDLKLCTYSSLVKCENKEKGSNLDQKDKSINILPGKTEGKQKMDKKENVVKEKFLSMAEQVNAFHKITPQRFHSRNHKDPPSLPRANFLPSITIAKTPNLRARFRTRPVTVVSKEQKELEELEECKKQFKARPLDKKILEKKIVQLEKKPTTIQEPFNLTKMEKILKSNASESEKKDFRARPIPAHLFERPLGLRPLKRLELTSPKSPHFAWKNRLRTLSNNSNNTSSKFITPETNSNANRRRSKSCSSNILSYKKQLGHSTGILSKLKWENKKTKVVPFSFDEVDKKRFAEKEKKIENLINEEKKKHEFHSKPLPKLDEPTGIPEKRIRPLTELQPFHFKYENKSNHQSLNSEGDTSERRYEFRARQPVSLLKEPFIPAKSTKPPTNILNIHLKTEKRAHERKDFEEFLKRKEEEMKQLDLWREKEREKDKNVEIKELREQMVHKASRVKHYKPMKAPARLPLTVPQSPTFQKKEK